MATHETAPKMTDGQRNEIIETFIETIPSLNFYQAQMIIDNKRPFVKGIGAAFEPYLGSKTTAVSLPQGAIPADGVKFKLTIEATDPMEMLKSDGHDTSKWKFIGSRVVSRTSRFKLVRVGSCRNLAEVRKKIYELGFIPEGQCREAFKKAFQNNNTNVVIGFADPSWVNSGVYFRFPVLQMIGKVWISSFFDTESNFNDYWRWLVES